MQELSEIEGGLSNLCRLCGEVDDVCFDVFDEKGREAELLSKIELSIRIAISQDDGLPTGLCKGCHDKLLEYTSFYQQCHDTQERLQEFISIESAMQKSCDGDQAVVYEYEIEEGAEIDADGENVYYYEDVTDAGDSAELMAVEESQDPSGEEQHYILPDDNDEGLWADTEKKKALPSSVQKEEIMQASLNQSNSLHTEKAICIKSEKEDPSPITLPFRKLISNSKKDVSAGLTSIVGNVGGASSAKIRSSAGPISSTEPPPLVHIARIVPKVLPLPPLVPIVCQATPTLASNVMSSTLKKAAPLLVPIMQNTSSSKPALVPIRTVTCPVKTSLSTVKNTPSKYSSKGHVIRNSKDFDIKAKKAKHLDLNDKPESILIVKSNMAVKEQPISASKGKGRVFIMSGDKSVAVEVAKKAKKGKHLDLNDKPESILIVKNKMAVKEQPISASKGKGRVFIMSGDKSVAVEVDTVQPTQKKSEKSCTLPSPIPYLVLKNGQLVTLDKVEKEVPLSQIPIPPVIVIHTSKKDDGPPKIHVQGDINFPDPSSYSTPAADLGAGLMVRPYPGNCATNFKVSTHSSTTFLKSFVVQNHWLRQRRKRAFVVRQQGRRFRAPPCPEAASQVEDIPVDPPQYKCKLCTATYSEKKRCEYHVITKHMSENCSYECDECDQKFATNFLRSVHKKKKHIRAPDFICSVCGATFRSLEVLEGHELRHASREAPYKCNTCGKGFYTKANCNKHQIDVHSEKKAICDVCGEAFSSMGRLNEHRYSHSGGLKCGQCGKVIYSRSRFRAHMQKHKPLSSVVKHVCTCGKKFATFAFYHNHKEKCPKFVKLSNTIEVPSATEESEDYEYDYADDEETQPL